MLAPRALREEKIKKRDKIRGSVREKGTGKLGTVPKGTVPNLQSLSKNIEVQISSKGKIGAKYPPAGLW